MSNSKFIEFLDLGKLTKSQRPKKKSDTTRDQAMITGCFRLPYPFITASIFSSHHMGKPFLGESWNISGQYVDASGLKRFVGTTQLKSTRFLSGKWENKLKPIVQPTSPYSSTLP